MLNVLYKCTWRVCCPQKEALFWEVRNFRSWRKHVTRACALEDSTGTYPPVPSFLATVMFLVALLHHTLPAVMN